LIESLCAVKHVHSKKFLDLAAIRILFVDSGNLDHLLSRILCIRR